MSETWQSVPLGNVLTHRKQFVEISDTTLYKRCRVQLHAKGVELRDIVPGAEIKTKRQQVCKSNDFLVAEIDAKVGGFGLVSPALDGAIVSSHYFLFSINEDLLDRQFLGFFIRTRAFREQVTAQGSTNYAAIRPSDVMMYTLPLPPLAEQRRIVARIEELATKIEEARGLRAGTTEIIDQLLSTEELKVWPDEALSDATTLEDVTTFLARGKQSEQGESEHYLIKTQHVQMGNYIPTKMKLALHIAQKVHPDAILKPGDILIACSAAGCLGRVARYEDRTQTCSTDTHIAIARPRTDTVTTDYLYRYLAGAQGQTQLRMREKGDWQREKVGFRLTELNLADLRKVPVPVPGPERQQEIVEQLNRVEARCKAIKALQSQTANEINALLPSVLDRAFQGKL